MANWRSISFRATWSKITRPKPNFYHNLRNFVNRDRMPCKHSLDDIFKNSNDAQNVWWNALLLFESNEREREREREREGGRDLTRSFIVSRFLRHTIPPNLMIKIWKRNGSFPPPVSYPIVAKNNRQSSGSSCSSPSSSFFSLSLSPSSFD